GRLLDLMNQGFVDLRAVEVLVLDEADHMLDMGFIHDIRRIVAKVPKQRQTLFFSATMPPEIRKLADSILVKPVCVQVAPQSAPADNVAQSIFHVRKKNKPVLLAHLLSGGQFTRSLVFTRTKSGANRVVRELERAGIASEAIHGNKSQAARERAIQNFKGSKTHVLVATDIAARGLDIDDISHVVNYDLPNVPETYVHRIGRTARAGASGVAVSFCDPEERPHLKAIERLTRTTIAVNEQHPEYPAVSDTHEEHDRPLHGRQQPSRHQPRRPKQAHGTSNGQGQSRGQAPTRGHAPSRGQSSSREQAPSRGSTPSRGHAAPRAAESTAPARGPSLRGQRRRPGRSRGMR
ncbi:MAG TPA: DEAD/DEAH box helicase, partial [Phycisphaerae bacterium]|nr:DEAD/DEAH box helicase [Phycisphaerae bacterium]